MQNSRLNNLPGELRNNVYKLVFADDNSWFHCRADHVPVYANKHTRDAEGTQQHPLLQVCKQMRRETNELYYASNDFLFPICFVNPNVPMLDAWFTMLGEKRCAAIRCVTLMLWHWQMMLGDTNGINLCKSECGKMWRVVFKHGMQQRIQIAGDEMRHKGLRGEDKRSLFHRGKFQDQEEVLNGMVKEIFLEVAAEADTDVTSKTPENVVPKRGKKREAEHEPLRRSKRIRAMAVSAEQGEVIVEKETETMKYDAAFYATMRQKVDDRVYSDEEIARSEQPVQHWRPSQQYLDQVAAELNELFP